MRYRGILTDWKDDQGFGFIRPDNDGEDVFVHISGFESNQPRPKQHMRVGFEVGTDENGRRRANHVTIIRTRFSNPLYWSAANVAFSWSIIAVLALCVFAIAGKLQWAIPAVCCGSSLITLAAYAIDKSAAQNGRRRTPETALHLLHFVGGWPGGLLAQKIFHHKSRKVSFQIVFWITAVASSAVTCWLWPT